MTHPCPESASRLDIFQNHNSIRRLSNTDQYLPGPIFPDNLDQQTFWNNDRIVERLRLLFNRDFIFFGVHFGKHTQRFRGSRRRLPRSQNPGNSDKFYGGRRHLDKSEERCSLASCFFCLQYRKTQFRPPFGGTIAENDIGFGYAGFQ